MMAPAPAPIVRDSSPISLAMAARSASLVSQPAFFSPGGQRCSKSWNCRAKLPLALMVAGSLALAALAARNSSSAAL